MSLKSKMGNCCCLETTIISVAIKFPHGTNGINIEKNGFVPCDINDWISDKYINNQFDSWIVYNDENRIDHKTSKGHCKGIVAWNDTSISWLLHSTPNFPDMFNGKTISKIDESELIYVQSFQYIQIPYTSEKLIDIIQQLLIMEAHIYLKHTKVVFPQKSGVMIRTIELTSTIKHIAKSHHYLIDLYSDHLYKEYPYQWKVETWIRGLKCKSNPHIKDIESITYQSTYYTESQDHSKWAVCDEYYFIGDLNRMTSQAKRGGGGMICKNKDICTAFQSIIKK